MGHGGAGVVGQEHRGTSCTPMLVGSAHPQDLFGPETMGEFRASRGRVASAKTLSGALLKAAGHLVISPGVQRVAFSHDLWPACRSWNGEQVVPHLERRLAGQLPTMCAFLYPSLHLWKAVLISLVLQMRIWKHREVR